MHVNKGTIRRILILRNEPEDFSFLPVTQQVPVEKLDHFMQIHSFSETVDPEKKY